MDESSLSFRAVEGRDTALLNELMVGENRGGLQPLSEADPGRSVLALMQELSPWSDAWIIEERGRSAGLLVVDRSDHELRILAFGVLPRFRKRGIAGAVVGGLQYEAANCEQALRLHLSAESSSRSFWEKHGFLARADRGTYVLYEWCADV